MVQKDPAVTKRVISPYGLGALAIILLAVGIRIALLRLDWPLLDSDEGTMGLMAMHIAYRGEHPIFFYGQAYMGAFEAYVAAFFFLLFGVSSFTLRIGLVLIYAGFLGGMYFLSGRLYSKKLALFTLLLLAFGSNPLLNRQLVAVGGDPETLLCGPFLLLIPLYLALDYSREEVRRRRLPRLLAYTVWGLLAGFGLWSHMLTAPFILFGGLILLFFCWRELLGWPLLVTLAGFMVCTWLQIEYNLHVPPNRSSLFYLLNVLRAGGTPQLPKHILLPLQIKGALLITLPTATGSHPLCAVSAVHAFGFGNLHELHCTLMHTGWSTGVILLWLLASLSAFYGLWRLWFHARPWQPEARRSFIIQYARLSLLMAGALPVVLYAASPNSAFFPVATTRYLIGVLVSTPAVLWPLWRGAILVKPLLLRFGAKMTAAVRGEQFVTFVSRALLVGILGIFMLGTFSTFTGIPAQPPLDPQQDVYFTQNSTQHLDVPITQQFNQQERTLISTLLHDGVTRIYSDYWSCDRLIFRSREQIACSALRERLELGHNRYEQYRRLVAADPQAAYVFHADSWPDHTLEQHIASGDKKYQRYQRTVISGYAVYRPLLTQK